MMAPSPPFQNSRPIAERRPHEEEVVELVEIPLVEQEAVEQRIGVGEPLRRRPVDDVHVVGDQQPAEHHQRRRQRDQRRDVLHLLEDLVVRADEQRTASRSPRSRRR